MTADTSIDAALRSELVRLADDDGMSIKKLGENCPVLMTLPPVDDHFLKTQPRLAGRDAAAYQVLLCAIDRCILRWDLRIAILIELNHGPTIDVTGAFFRADQLGDSRVPKKLRDRRIAAQRVLSESTDSYMRLSRIAFYDLRQVLLSEHHAMRRSRTRE